MKQTITLLLLFVTATAFAGPVEDVANAERAFAKAFADRDQAKFMTMVAPDANFLSFRTLRGKDAVAKGWSRLFEGPAPFSWGPERVEVTADGKLGLSTGPIYDTNGKHTGDYSSIWQKQSDGSWKVIFDGPGSAPAEVGKVEEGFINADDGTKLRYRKFGEGPVTLIVPLDSDFHEQFLQFANIATVIAYDLRNRERWTIQQDLKDLETVRRELKVEKFVPVGFSNAGVMVAFYALDHPDRVTRIVQISPAPLQTPEKLHAIKVPVLTIGGSVEWAKALPDARLIPFRGAAWLDDPVTVFASIRHFLRGEWPIGSVAAR